MLLVEKKMEALVDENPKVAIRHICGELRPTALREKIENDILLHKSTLGKDRHKFYKYVMEKTVALDEFLPAIEKAASSSGSLVAASYDNKYHDNKANKVRNRKSDSGRTDKASVTSPAHPSGRKAVAISSSNKLRDAREPPYCLNTKKCYGIRHYMRDCPDTSAEEGKLLVQAYREKEKGNTVRRVLFSDTIDSSDEEQQTAEKHNATGRLVGKLADTVQVVVCGDYGADHAGICEEHLKKLAAAQIFVPTLPLSDPIMMQLAVQGSDQTLCATATKMARVSVTLHLPEGPLRLRNVEFMVFKENMPEVLLSRPLLVSLGFDLDAHLARVRGKYHDQDFSAVGFDPNFTLGTDENVPKGRLAKLMQNAIEYDQPVDFLQDNGNGNVAEGYHDDFMCNYETSKSFAVGDHIPSEIRPHLERMLQEAVDNGMSPNCTPKLRHILDNYEKVFRLKLGTDPPVDVEPMHIRLDTQARPIRVKVRRYTPCQAEFMKVKVAELERLGLVRRNTESAWACAPLIVLKPGPENSFYSGPATC